MDYSKIKQDIEQRIKHLAKDIEKFCVLENKEYTNIYKNQLWEIHRLLEELD